MSKKRDELAKELMDIKFDEEAEITPGSMDLDADEFEGVQDQLVDEGTSVDKANKDQTVRLVHTQSKSEPQPDDQTPAPFQTSEEQEKDVKISYGLPTKLQNPSNRGGSLFAGDNHLKQSEHLRIAQRKINDLEEEVSQLRRENEDLASAGETFKKLNDEYYLEIESLKSKLFDQKQTSVQEIKLLKKIGQGKDKIINELKQKVDEYKSRIDNSFQRVRKREKDLEHRLEIAKIEEAAVVKSKDQLILDLKRRLDDVSHESDNFRKKSQENYKEVQRKQQVVRGAVRALKLALTKLEGDDDSDFEVESAEGRNDS